MHTAENFSQPSSAVFAVPSGSLSYRFFLSATLLVLALFSFFLQQAGNSIFILALLNLFFCADVFFRSACKDLGNGRITWALWVSLAVLAGVAYSGVNSLAHVGWLRPAGNLCIYTILLSCFALWGARRLAVEKERAHVFTKKIDDFLPKSGRLLENGRVRTVFASEIVEGDILVVRAGERFPADGIICKGKTLADEQLITGNILPAAKRLDSQVYAGTLNKTAEVELEVTRPLKNSAVMSVIDAIKNAEISHTRPLSALDRFAKYAVPAAYLIIVAVYLVRVFVLQGDWVQHAGPLLCALALICPLGLVLGEVFPALFMCRGARKAGVALQNVHAVAQLAQADVVFFDKTGTLTFGRLRVSGIFPAAARGEKALLEAVCNAEQAADGPFAEAVKRLAHRKNIKLKALQENSIYPGLGVEVFYDKKKITAGSIPWFKEKGIEIPAEAEQTQEAVICVADGNKFIGYLTLADDLREGAAETVALLKAQGKEVMLVSGDTENSVARVAEQTGIEKMNYFVLPKTKAEIITNLRSLGKKVVMVGDGFNDIIALLKADAGVVFFSGKNVYNNWVDIVLKTERMSPLRALFTLHRKHRRIVYENLFLGLAVQAVFVTYLCGAAGSAYVQAGSLRGLLAAGGAGILFICLNSVRMLKINDTQK